MNQFRFWVTTVLLVTGAGVSVSRAADPNDKSSEATPAGRPTVRAPVIIEPLPPETLAEVLRAEQDAYIRRLDVCTKLRAIADQTGNEQLATEARELERRATALYQQRVSKIGIRPGSQLSATSSLERSLGTGAAVNPLNVTPPAPAQPARSSLANLREVAP